MRSMGENYNNPIPFLIFAALIGLLFGSWWIGLLIGIALTLIPFVSVGALFVNNLLLKIPLLIGFPFYMAYLGIRRVVAGRQDHG